MRASLDDAASLLAKVNIGQITALVQALQKFNYNKKEFIEQRYHEYALHFGATLTFLIEIGWVLETADGLFLIKNPSDDKIVENLIESLIHQPTSYQFIASDYLANYIVSGEGIVCRQSGKRRPHENAMRNLLIDLRVISYEADSDWYLLNAAYTELYLWAKNNQNTISREAFDASNKKKQALGAAAETAVMDFERSRVPAWQNRIDHVSARQPFACYDIISVTVTGDSVEPRYIEVKAVNGTSFHFFWTHTEMEAARLLGSAYYLYLLPVLPNEQFAIDQMLIIQNPYKNVFCNSHNWNIKNELISCHLLQSAIP